MSNGIALGVDKTKRNPRSYSSREFFGNATKRKIIFLVIVALTLIVAARIRAVLTKEKVRKDKREVPIRPKAPF